MKVGDKVYRVDHGYSDGLGIGVAVVSAIWKKDPNMVMLSGDVRAWGFRSRAHVDHCHSSPLSAAQRYLNECADELTAARKKHKAAIEFVAEVAKGTP